MQNLTQAAAYREPKGPCPPPFFTEVYTALEIHSVDFSVIVFCAKNLRRKRVICEICYWGVVKRRNRLRLLLFSVMISHIGSGIKSQLAKRAIVSLFIFVNFHMFIQTSSAPELFPHNSHSHSSSVLWMGLRNLLCVSS